MRLKLTIAYDGRPFLGWQSQTGGNTIQDHIHQAIAEIAKQPLRNHAAGRTDTGVHAHGQVAHIDAPEGTTMNPFTWVPATWPLPS
jgi:tRNA pseudouridine38-40 synthase